MTFVMAKDATLYVTHAHAIKCSHTLKHQEDFQLFSSFFGICPAFGDFIVTTVFVFKSLISNIQSFFISSRIEDAPY